MALVMNNTIPLSPSPWPNPLPHTRETSNVFHSHACLCDNQEYIAHPTKGECDDKKKKKATPTQRKKNMMIKKNKAHPKSELILLLATI
jgi:hypothetical protein